jgi:hypothetical protein
MLHRIRLKSASDFYWCKVTYGTITLKCGTISQKVRPGMWPRNRRQQAAGVHLGAFAAASEEDEATSIDLTSPDAPNRNPLTFPHNLQVSVRTEINCQSCRILNRRKRPTSAPSGAGCAVPVTFRGSHTTRTSSPGCGTGARSRFNVGPVDIASTAVRRADWTHRPRSLSLIRYSRMAAAGLYWVRCSRLPLSPSSLPSGGACGFGSWTRTRWGKCGRVFPASGWGAR